MIIIANSIDDMAMYDLPAMVNYVLETTGLPDLSYVGHSLGTMTFFMAASTNRDFHSKVCANIYFRFLLYQPKSDCIYHFLIDSELNGFPFCSKSIWKW